MATLFFDGDLRRIYEVPENSSYSIVAGGYRVYTPDDITQAKLSVNMSIEYVWNRYTDYNFLNEWATLAFNKAGGAFRFPDENGNPIYATADFRLINNWELVQANYPHEWNILGNLFGDINTGKVFDISNITAQGVSPSIQRADSLQVITVEEEGLTTQQLRDAIIEGLKATTCE